MRYLITFYEVHARKGRVSMSSVQPVNCGGLQGGAMFRPSCAKLIPCLLCRQPPLRVFEEGDETRDLSVCFVCRAVKLCMAETEGCKIFFCCFFHSTLSVNIVHGVQSSQKQRSLPFLADYAFCKSL